MYEQRGVITFRDRYKQINDFSGLVRLRKITPTDIDGIIHYREGAFIYLEGKKIDAPFPYGQKKCLEELCRSNNKAGDSSCVIVYEHNTDSNLDVNVAQCFVKLVFAIKNKKLDWYPIIKPITVKDLVAMFERKFNIR